nr:unnamed protein product [Callosobruchus analis]
MSERNNYVFTVQYSTAVKQFLSDCLDVRCNENEIDTVFRLNKGDSDSSNKPKIMLLTFTTSLKKQPTISKKNKLKGTGISIYEDLSRKNCDLLRLAKNKYGIKNAWSSAAKIYVKKDGDKKIVKCG